MRPIRAGTITHFEQMSEQSDGSIVYKFRLDSNQDESLTVCIPAANRADTPVLNQRVLVYLYPEDSKWPKHASQVVRDVPERIVLQYGQK